MACIFDFSKFSSPIYNQYIDHITSYTSDITFIMLHRIVIAKKLLTPPRTLQFQSFSLMQGNNLFGHNDACLNTF